MEEYKNTKGHVDFAFLLITLAGGVIWYFLGNIIYSALKEKLWRPLLIGLYFFGLALIVLLCIFLANKIRGYRVWNEKNKYIAIAIVPVVLIVGGLLQLLYQSDFRKNPSCPTSYIFVVDTSSSMDLSDPQDIRIDAIKRVAGELDPDIPVSVVTFDNDFVIEYTGTADKLLQFDLILNDEGSTDMVGALNRVLDLIDSNEIEGGYFPKMILLSDGVPDSTDGLETVFKRAADMNISICTVGFDYCDVDFLLNIANNSDGIFVWSDNVDDLPYATLEAATSVGETRDLLSIRTMGDGNVLYSILRFVIISIISALFFCIKALIVRSGDSDLNIVLPNIILSVMGAVIVELGLNILGLSGNIVRALMCVFLSSIVVATPSLTDNGDNFKIPDLSFEDDPDSGPGSFTSDYDTGPSEFDDTFTLNYGRQQKMPAFHISAKALVLVLAVIAAAGISVIIAKNVSTKPSPSQAPVLTVSVSPSPASPNINQQSNVSPTPTFQSAPNTRYFRSELTGNDAAVYDIIYNGLVSHDDTISGISLPEPDSVNDIYLCVLWDNPELFWASGAFHYSYSQAGNAYDIVLTPKYYWNKTDSLKKSDYVKNLFEQVTGPIKNASDYEKVKAVYEYLINNTVYDLAYEGRTLYELFYDGRAVCEGYAKAAQYLLNDLGVETIFVTGEGTNELGTDSHAWNIVKIGVDYYHIDVTWGDSASKYGNQDFSYAYLNLTDADMEKQHSWDHSPYPICNSIEYNYYIFENKMLYAYDEQLLNKWLQEAWNVDKKLEFRAVDADVYNDIMHRLEEGDDFFRLLDNIPDKNDNAFSYSHNDDMLVIGIYL